MVVGKLSIFLYSCILFFFFDRFITDKLTTDLNKNPFGIVDSD